MTSGTLEHLEFVNVKQRHFAIRPFVILSFASAIVILTRGEEMNGIHKTRIARTGASNILRANELFAQAVLGVERPFRKSYDIAAC